MITYLTKNVNFGEDVVYCGSPRLFWFYSANFP